MFLGEPFLLVRLAEFQCHLFENFPLFPPFSDKPEEIQLSAAGEENNVQGREAELRAAPHRHDPKLQEPGLPLSPGYQAGEKTAHCKQTKHGTVTPWISHYILETKGKKSSSDGINLPHEEISERKAMRRDYCRTR